MFSSRVGKWIQNLPRRLLSKHFTTESLLPLNDLQPIKEAVKKAKRVGRGVGSGRGKNSGRGHQGNARSTPRAFEGGQTNMYKRFPKIGFSNHGARDLQVVNLNKIQEFIDMGRLKATGSGSDSAVPKMITMRDLVTAGIVTRAKEGIKLLAKGANELRTPIHLEVSMASKGAIQSVEAVGGTVTCAHFNRLALRALLKPLKFDIYPRRARPPPKIIDYYLDKDNCGYLSPEIQIRNLKLFGAVTSEPDMRARHLRWMDGRRAELHAQWAREDELYRSGPSAAGDTAQESR